MNIGFKEEELTFCKLVGFNCVLSMIFTATWKIKRCELATFGKGLGSCRIILAEQWSENKTDRDIKKRESTRETEMNRQTNKIEGDRQNDRQTDTERDTNRQAKWIVQIRLILMQYFVKNLSHNQLRPARCDICCFSFALMLWGYSGWQVMKVCNGGLI